MIQELNVGETVAVKEFAFMNKAGGTGMSNWEFDPKFSGKALVRIVRRWDDYETGERAVGEAVSEDLTKYLEENASPTDKRVFIGEFDLTK
jgi:hypothetical protein